MARPITAANIPAPRPRRRWLLGGSALCGASLVFAVAAQAQTLPAIPAAAAIKFSTGGALPTITAPNANTLDVALNAPRTVINWDSFHVSAADAVTYHFGQTSDIVLNKSPTQIQIDANGHVTGLVGAVAGGNIWFYSPGGVVISPGAVMSAGNFVLAKGPAIDDATFVDAASPLGVLRAASDSLIQIDTITLATSASIGPTGDLVLTASSGDLNATTALAAGSATVSATTGSVNVGEVTAGGTATVTAPAGAISLGQLNGSSVSATGLTTVSVTSAAASGLAGDIVLNGGSSASLGSGTAGRDIKVIGPGATLGGASAGDSVFVTATTGLATVSGTVTAGNDIEITSTTGSVSATTATLTATGSGATDDAHVLAQSTAGSVSVGSATTQGAGVTAGDITINGATGATLGSGHSSQDLKVLGPTAGLGSGSAARDVFVTATTGGATVTGAVLAGDDIEVTATTGAVTATTGSLTAGGPGAVGDAHVLARSTGGSATVGSAATQGTGAAAGDITVSGATSASLGSGNSSHDLKVLGPAASLGSGSAADSVFVTATTGAATVTGAVSAGNDIEVTATTGSVAGLGASLTATGVGATDDAHVLARSTGGSVSLTSAATQGSGAAAGDITVDGATGATLGSGSSSRDLKVLGPSAGLGFGIAARDVFVTATTGTATVTSQAVAGDDIEVTATTGSVAAGGADLKSNGTGAVGDAHVLAQSTGGSVAVGSAETQGTGAAAGDITVSGATTASLSSGASSHDIKVLAPTASLGSGNAANSVLVTATTGSATVTGAVTAGNDIEVTATTGSVTTTGASLTATGVGAADDAHVLLQSTGGAVSVGSAATQGTGAAAGDVTIGASTTATLTGTINSARDVSVTAGDVLAGGSTVSATRDLAVSATTGNVALGTASAGDDIAVRALAGAITGSGDLQSGQTHDPADPDPSGAADTLVGSTLTGHDIDLKAQTIAITGNVAAGRAPDVNETLGAAQVASTLVAEATNPDPAPGTAALQLATGPGKSVTAHSDISLKAENAAASSIQTGDVFAGGDVAVDSAAGNITMASALAGDDVVLRALSGAISVAGNVESGRDSPGMTPTDSVGAGDALNAAKPFSDFDGNPATVFSAVGFDVNIVSQAVHVGGAAIAGRQPSTDAPNLAGPVDASTSDLRIETRISATPVNGLDPNISLGSAIATRDMQIDSAKAITTGALIAGRDIAVLGRGAPTPGAAPGDHTGAGTTIASEQAGDDALSFSIYGRTHILGSVTAGTPILRLVPTTDTNIDGATQAADQLAIYLHYFDLDNASEPLVLPGGVIHIVGQGVTVGGALSAHGVGSDIRILSSLDIGVLGAVTAGGKATFQTLPGGGAVNVGSVTAVGDVFLDGGGAGTGVLASGALTSTNGQVAIRARDGADISLGSVSAGDDLVIRGTAGLTISGPVNVGGGTDAVGLGDALVTSDGALTLAGHAYDLTGHNIDVTVGSVTTPGTLTAVGDIRLQTTGAVSLTSLSAGRDVLVDAGSTVLTGSLSAGRDIGVRSTGAGASVTIGAASAGDDLVVRAKGSIFATGTLSSGGGADSAAADQAGDLIFSADMSNLGGNLNLTGQTVDLRSTAGSITVTGAVNAATDARFQTATGGGSVTVGAVTAGRDLLLDGGGGGPNGVLAAGALTSTNGQVAIRARDGTDISLASVSAGDDLVIRGTGALTLSGAVNVGGGADSAGLGDALVTASGALTVAGHAYDLSGHNVDIVAGSLTTPATLSSVGDLRIQTTGAVSLTSLTAGRDVLVDSGSTVLTGSLSAGRDIGVRSTGAGASVTIGDASAGDDLVVRAKGSIFATGTLTSGGGADSAAGDQAGDLIFSAAATNLAGNLNLTGQNIDLRSSAGSITVTGAVNAASDARFQTQAITGGAVTVGTVTAGRDLLLDGGGAGGVLATGTLTATSGDVAVRARDGSTASLANVSAGDDVAIRASGDLTISGAVNAGGGADSVGLGDALKSASGAVTVAGHAYDLSGNNIDIVAGTVTTPGLLSAVGDVRLQATGAIDVFNITAGRDLLVDSGSTVLTGILSAGRDIGVRSTGAGASVTIGNASAGDDLVIRAKGSIFATGTLSAGSGADSAATDQAGDLIFSADPSNLGGNLNLTGRTIDVRSTAGSITVTGSVNAATDARFQTGAVTGGSVTVADVTAGRSVLLDGGGVGPNGVLASGTLTATSGDVAVRARDGSAISLADVSAGDDVVLRAAGAITVNGAVNAGGGTDSVGLGDALSTTEGAVTLEGHAYDLTGHNVDIVGGSVTTIGGVTAAGDARFQSVGALNLGALTAGRDVLVDGASTVLTGVLSAGRDVGVRSTGDGASVTVGGASAGDDVVIRAKGSIFVTGPLSAGLGADSSATDQAGDLMFGAAKSNLGADLDLVGGTVDVRSSAGSISVTGAVTAATDARFQTQATTGGSVTVAAVTAGRDVLLDGGGAGPNGAVATGTLTATNGDVAVRARDGKGINLAGISAGDDVVLRTTGSVLVNGTVTAGSGADSTGLGDVLLTTDGVVTLQGQSYDLTGHDVDIVAGSVMTIGTITATGVASDVRVQSLGALNLGGLTAGRDVLVDGGSTVATGLLTAGRDVGARSTGVGAQVSIGGASAGDDVVIRANGSIFVTGPLSAGGGTDSNAADQAGDLMFGVAKSSLAGALDLVGQMVDVRSTAGSIQVTGATNAATDARFQTQATTGGSVTVGAVTAGRDILLDGGPGLGPNGAQATGTLTATSGDVAVRARDGSAISLADVSAGDDVVLRSTGDIRGSGAVTTTGQASTVGLGDKLIDPSESGALSVGGLTFGLGDSDIDIIGNVIGILRASAVGGVRILAGAGSLMGGASAGTDILIDSTADLTVGDLTAAGDIALRSKSGSLTTGSLSAGDDIVLRAAQGVTAGMLKVGGSDHVGVGDMLFLADPTALGGSFDVTGATIDVKSGSGPITISGAQGPGDIRLQTTGGVVTISGAVTAGRDFFADGGSVAATGGLTATRDVALFGRTGNVAVASVTAGNDFVVRAGGDVTASGDLKAGQTPATGGVGDRLIAAGSGAATLFGEAADAGVGVLDLRGANITLSGAVDTEAGAHLRLQSTGATTLGTATVAGDISIDAAGDLTAGDLSAGRDVALRSTGGGISIASAKAGDDIVLRAANAIAVSGQLNAGQGADAAGAGDGLFSLNPTSLGGDFDLAGGNVDLKSAAGGISALGAISAPTDVRLQAAGAVVTGSVAAGRDILLDGGAVTGADVRAGRDVAVRAQTDSVTLASVAAGDDVVLRAAKDVTVSGAISAGGAADSAGAGDRLFATDKTALNGDFDLSGGNIDVRAHGAITVGGAATAAGDARFQTLGSGAVSLAAVTAGGDVLADGAAVQASGALLANRDVAVRGRTGAVRLATIKAGDDIAIRAGGDVSVTGTLSSGSGPSATGAADRLISSAESGPIMRLVDPLAATASIEGFTLANGDIDIKSGGAISLNGDVNAAGSASGVHLQAAGKISAGSVTAGDSIFARGGDFALGGAWRANTARLEVTAAGGLALGEGVSAASGGVALSSSAIGLIDAPTLQIFLGDSSGTMRGAGLSIGTLNIDVAKIKTSLELYAGAASQVVISGAFAPSSGGVNSTMVRIGAPNADVGDWTPGSIRVIANSGGSIGVSTTVTGRTFSDIRAFGSVELNATNDILIGYQDFIDKLSATSAAGVSSAVRVLTAPQTLGGQRMLITAGTLTLRANGKVAQQDTEGLLGNNPMGLYLFGGSATVPQLVLGRTSGKSVGAVTLPDYIELNGALTTAATILTGTNASLANVIAFANGVTPSAYYRINSCAIMQPGSCTSSSVHSTVSIAPDQLTNLTVQDRTAAAGTADPTVASATNEESWKDPK
ncbi:hypothetical protein [Phenylobacterium sp.]|uniref:beta strand repeat-containing protein n=1 Tax=Phenylobacterium sp. TaxID=1871053 RepID=UPI002C011C4E|nr:hypothetical protein [Phenylobacterium sp.]HLZ77442.1 hypothetical protein [Phenylobacterium sp.]